MDKLRRFVDQNIEEMHESQANTMHFKAASIDEIMPGDIIQHIISFQVFDLENVKFVNKQWNKLSKQNEKNFYLQLKSQPLADETPSNASLINNDRSTWILHSKRPRLTEVEKELGFKGPLKSIQDAVDQLQKDDAFIMHSITNTEKNELSQIIKKYTSVAAMGNVCLMKRDKLLCYQLIQAQYRSAMLHKQMREKARQYQAIFNRTDA